MSFCILLGGHTGKERVNSLMHHRKHRMGTARMTVNTAARLKHNLQTNGYKLGLNLPRVQTAERHRKYRGDCSKLLRQDIIVANNLHRTDANLSGNRSRMQLVTAAQTDKFCNRPHLNTVMRIPGKSAVHCAVNVNRHRDFRIRSK